MRKNILMLLTFLPLFVNAQAPWKDFYEGETDKKGRPQGQGVIGFGNFDLFTRFEGFFEKGIPGDGKHPSEIWVYREGKLSRHEKSNHVGKEDNIKKPIK